MTLEKTIADCSSEDKEYARIILDLVLKDLGTWMTEVSTQKLLGICSLFKPTQITGKSSNLSGSRANGCSTAAAVFSFCPPNRYQRF